MIVRSTQTNIIAEWNEGISEAGGFIKPKGKQETRPEN